jgi:hypothetical protein|tara:strand:- start:110 stop:544 length:435 start_codon:yes stop_codon:yes gene_type:complete
MQNKNLLNQKKGQIGETMTWVVATLIIIVILFISIYMSSLISKTKILDSVDFDPENLKQNLLVKKSMMAFVLTSEGNLNEFNKNLAIEIFEKIYGKEFYILMGINDNLIYIGPNPELTDFPEEIFLEKIKLNDKNELNLILKKR